MPSDPYVARVLRCVEKERRAAADTRAALADAYDHGVSYAELGRALGISRQACRQLVERFR